MSHGEIIRAWKDPDYRASLSADTRSRLPANPAGTIDLPEPTLQPAAGAVKGFRLKSAIRAGYRSANPDCSVYGDNLWTDELNLN